MNNATNFPELAPIENGKLLTCSLFRSLRAGLTQRAESESPSAEFQAPAVSPLPQAKTVLPFEQPVGILPVEQGVPGATPLPAPQIASGCGPACGLGGCPCPQTLNWERSMDLGGSYTSRFPDMARFLPGQLTKIPPSALILETLLALP